MILPVFNQQYLISSNVRIKNPRAFPIKHLKVVTIPLHPLFDVAFYVDNKFCVENMHILEHMRPKICIKGSSKNYVTARGGRGSTILLHIVTYISGGRGVF